VNFGPCANPTDLPIPDGMKAFSRLLILLAFAGPLQAQWVPVNTFLWAFPSDGSACDATTSIALIHAGAPDAERIAVFRIVTDFTLSPCGRDSIESPFTVREYRSLSETLEPYFRERVRRRDAWIVGPTDGRFFLVTRR
jgi:hypothetical protein